MAETFDMSYQETNITRVRGDTFPFSFVIKDSSGTVVDISGFSYKLSVDPSDEPSDETGQLFQVVGVVPTGTDGVVTFTLSADNADQTPGTYYFDLEQTDDNSKIRTVAKGEWIVKQDVTKEP
jgi:hypothetical protein